MKSTVSPNVVREAALVADEDRARTMDQRGCTVWLTGLSGSGKSTIAKTIEKILLDDGHAAYVLDGDNIRHGLNGDLGFSPADRKENIRRIGHVAALFADAGVIAITAFISPYRADRDLARELHNDNFIEVYVDCPIEKCEERDVKGLYKKARAGEITDFTGVSTPYEAPENPELRLSTAEASVEKSAQAVLDFLKEKGFLRGV